MHDGRSLTRLDAMRWHAGEATDGTGRYRALSNTEKSQLLEFLDSL